VSFDIKTVDPADFVAWYDTISTAYFRSTDVEPLAQFRSAHVDFARTWAAYDHGQVVATLRTFATPITVPGNASVAADAVTNVSTLPTHRRKGALTGMMTASLQAAVDRGDPLSILLAARWPIYGRFGYGAATEGANYEIDATAADFGAAGRSGELEFVDKATARSLVPPVFERHRSLHPGAIARADHDFDLDFGLVVVPGRTAWDGRIVIHRSAGSSDVDGYLRYHVDDNWNGLRPHCVLVVDDLVATTSAAYAALWRLGCEIDNVTTVKTADRSIDEPLPWLLADARAITQTARTDFVWVRLLDISAALSARSYLTDGRIVLDVHDRLKHAEGRYLLEAGPLGATCVPSSEPADLELDVATLGSVYLGGTHLRTLAAAGLVTEHRTGALNVADAMFIGATVPWCNTWF
jgi:predicted acetyltransferase